MSESQNKRRDLSFKEKLDILERYSKLPKMSQRNAASQLGISQPLLCKILKNKDFILLSSKSNGNIDSKRNRSGKDPQVESALKLWFQSVREKDAKVDGPLLRQKAEDFAKKIGKQDFKATDGWFNRWKKRENIVFEKSCGEKKDADFFAAQNWLQYEWPKIVADYSPSCVYNAVKTGLYYRALPEYSYVFKDENASGNKMCKQRITVMCCVNMVGCKENLLVIGKSKTPRCFQGIKKLPVEYYANSNAWMTSEIFNEWLTKWDTILKHNIVLLIDKCIARNDIITTLKHIKVIYFPANTASLIQPCDLGIIKSFKSFYRREMRARIADDTDEPFREMSWLKTTSLLNAVHVLAQSWNHVSEETIQHCFKKAGGSIKESQEQVTSEEEAEEKLNPVDLCVQEHIEWMDDDSSEKGAEIHISEDDICKAVASTSKVAEEENTVDDENEELVPHRSKEEVLQALEILRQFVQQKTENFNIHYEYEQFINSILREDCGQSRIEDISQKN